MNKKFTMRRINSRMIVGLVLIATSILGVFLLVEGASRTSTVLIAKRLLVEGHQIGAEDVQPIQAQIDSARSSYLTDVHLVVGKIASRAIMPGELIPVASVAESADVLETTVAVNVDAPVAGDLKPGALVDLWAAQKSTGSSARMEASPEPARLLVKRVRLAKHESPATALANPGERVELVLSRDDVATVLDAQSGGLGLYVVASAGGLL